MNNDKMEPNLNEAAGIYLASLGDTERDVARPALMRFVAWYGREKPFSSLSAPGVARYSGQMSRAEVDFTDKLKAVRGFLSFAQKQGWAGSNMALHVKASKKAPVKATQRRPKAAPVSETRQGAEKMHSELGELKNKRIETVEEMRIAAADKDFRENAPYHAAREKLSHIEGRIRELEATLKVVVVVDRGGQDVKVGIGDSIVLRDLTSGEELNYTIVGQKEVDPMQGKVSGASPIGRAVMGRATGEEVEVVAPAARLRYRIEKIGR